jgi:hypothetical protein
MRPRFALYGVMAAVCMASGFASPAFARGGSSFRRIAGGNVFSVAASGHHAFFVRADGFAPNPSGGELLTHSTGVLLNELTGRRRTLEPPGCQLPMGGMFGAGRLVVSCSDSSLLWLYDLASRTWESMNPYGSPPSPFLTCEEANPCAIAGVGRRWIELETTCYHCENTYYLQPIPSGPPLEPAAVVPGGGYTFGLNSPSGTEPLCRPLTYPRVRFEPVDGGGAVLAEPGWIDPLAKVAVISDSAPLSGSTTYIRLARCGTHASKRLHPIDPGEATVGSSAVAWWSPKWNQRKHAYTQYDINGVRLPSGNPFSLRLPARFGLQDSPGLAVSARHLYVEDHGLWRAALPGQ